MMNSFTKFCISIQFRIACALAISFGVLLTPAVSCAQDFPLKPVKVVVPYSAGGPTDLMARAIAKYMAHATGQMFTIENRGGAGGTIGTAAVARSAPDGYTLLFTTPSSQITPVYLTRSMPFDPRNDFTPIAVTGEPVACLGVNPKVPGANSFRELMENARRSPAKMSFASSGNGSVFHLVGEQVNQIAGVNITHVPYKAAAQSFTDVVAGQLEMVYASCNSLQSFAAAGKMRLAVQILPAGIKGRSPRLAEVPSMTELLPDYVKPPSWFAYFGPAGISRTIVDRLNTEIVKSLDVPDIRARLEDSGLYIMRFSAGQFEATYREGFDTYAKAVKAAGLKPE